MTNELARDKFIFGLMDQDSRQELLKTERKPDGTKKTLADVVSEAKVMEAAKSANQLYIADRNWTSHKDMKLKRETGTCHWCGDRRGPHAWNVCPANGTTCHKCGVNDHFARVCFAPNTFVQFTPQTTNVKANVLHKPTSAEEEEEDATEAGEVGVTPEIKMCIRFSLKHLSRLVSPRPTHTKSIHSNSKKCITLRMKVNGTLPICRYHPAVGSLRH